MGILQRFSDIMRSNINAALDKCEDPAKMVDQILLDLRKNLAEVKKETAGVMAVEKNAARLVEECKGNISKYTNAAQNALRAGNETDARILLVRRQEYESNLVGLQANYDAAHQNAEQLRQLHDKLVKDIESLEARKAGIKAKVATAKAQEQVNKATAGMSSSASISAFERMEAKANRRLDSALAEAELNAGMTSTDDLAAKYMSGGESGVDDELAKMKAELEL